MQLTGRVVWTGTSSMDIVIELEQAGQQQLSALFTFVAREPLTGAPCRIPSVLPQTPQVRLGGSHCGVCGREGVQPTGMSLLP